MRFQRFAFKISLQSPSNGRSDPCGLDLIQISARRKPRKCFLRTRLPTCLRSSNQENKTSHVNTSGALKTALEGGYDCYRAKR